MADDPGESMEKNLGDDYTQWSYVKLVEVIALPNKWDFDSAKADPVSVANVADHFLKTQTALDGVSSAVDDSIKQKLDRSDGWKGDSADAFRGVLTGFKSKVTTYSEALAGTHGYTNTLYDASYALTALRNAYAVAMYTVAQGVVWEYNFQQKWAKAYNDAADRISAAENRWVSYVDPIPYPSKDRSVNGDWDLTVDPHYDPYVVIFRNSMIDALKKYNTALGDFQLDMPAPSSASGSGSGSGSDSKHAKDKPDKAVKDAKDKADKAVKDAEDKADKVVKDAEDKADKAVKDAGDKAGKAQKDATDAADKQQKDLKDQQQRQQDQRKQQAQDELNRLNQQQKDHQGDVQKQQDQLKQQQDQRKQQAQDQLNRLNQQQKDHQGDVQKQQDQLKQQQDQQKQQALNQLNQLQDQQKQHQDQLNQLGLGGLNGPGSGNLPDYLNPNKPAGNLKVGPNGEILDANGNQYVSPTGQKMHVGSNGQIVDANGKPVKGPDGKPLHVDKNGNVVDANGTPYSGDGKNPYNLDSLLGAYQPPTRPPTPPMPDGWKIGDPRQPSVDPETIKPPDFKPLNSGGLKGSGFGSSIGLPGGKGSIGPSGGGLNSLYGDAATSQAGRLGGGQGEVSPYGTNAAASEQQAAQQSRGPMGGMPMSPAAHGGGQQGQHDEQSTWLQEDDSDVWGGDPDVAPAFLDGTC